VTASPFGLHTNNRVSEGLVVDATPARASSSLTKGLFLPMPELDEGVVVPGSSPVMSRKILQPRLPRVRQSQHRDSGIGMLPSSPPPKAGRDLAETPIKKLRLGSGNHMGKTSSLEGFITRTPLKPPQIELSTPGPAEIRIGNEEAGIKQKSIYAQLGWDDDVDDLV
jgi:hypothetical protein